MDTVIAQDRGIFQGLVEAGAKLRFTARQGHGAFFACRHIARWRVEQGLDQAIVVQTLFQLLRAVVVGEHVFHRLETIGGGRGEAVQKFMFRVEHAEVGSETRHGDS
ncbi:hypothetical protein D3C73_1353660 [compost metagenome]